MFADMLKREGGHLPPQLVILVNSFLAPIRSSDTPQAVTEGGPVAYTLMARKHAFYYLERRGAFEKAMNKAMSRTETGTEYPFSILPHVASTLRTRDHSPASSC